jgi:hypothetical protein
MTGLPGTTVGSPPTWTLSDPTIDRVRQLRLPAPASHADAASNAFSGDIVEEWGLQSFPASDPPANW